MKLAVKIPLLLVASATAAAMAAGSLINRFVAKAETREVLATATRSVRTYASAVTTHIADARLAIEVSSTDRQVAEAATAPAGAGGDLAIARAIVERGTTFEFAVLTDARGRVVEAAGVDPQPGLVPDVGTSRWFRDVARHQATVVSDLHISVLTSRPSVVIATPVRDAGGRFVGVWAGALRLAAFSEFGRVAGTPSAAPYGLLTDRHGLIIAHQAQPSYVVNQSDFSSVSAVRSALRGRSGAGRWRNPIDGEAKLGAYVPLPELGGAAVYATRASAALAPVRRVQRIIIDASLAIIALFALGGIALGRRAVRPLRELATAAADIASGEQDRHVEVRGHDEVAHLAGRFNAMVAALSAKDAEVRAHARSLEQANADLEAFTYTVSHDLRAPLRGIDGFSKILIDDYAGVLDGEARDYLERVRAGTQRMDTLINDLLTLSRIGRADLVRVPVDVTAMATRIAGDLRAADPSRHVRVDIAPGLVVNADSSNVEVALRNLLGNAWKFTGQVPHGHIELIAESPGTLTIRDNGAGFDMRYADKLFGAFQRLHPAAEFEGTGVGLATVLRIVRRHGGWIRAWGAVGDGATLTFSLIPGVAEPQSGIAGGDRSTPLFINA